MIRSMWMGCSGHITYMAIMRIAYKVLVGKLGGKSDVGNLGMESS
jgi:hypothetical protein